MIDRMRARPRQSTRVHFTAASPGINTPGTAYRMDKVPLPMRPALRSRYATDEDILRGIRQAVAVA